MLQKGDILICASSGSKHLVGKAAQVTFDGEYTFGAFCKVVRPKNINPAFLGFFFQSPNYRTRISNLAQGANINNIRNEHIDELEISTYESLIQDNIVQTLSIVAEIINRRKEQLRVLEELVKLRFVETFGDVIRNDKQWTMRVFSDITTSRLGKMLDSKQQTGKQSFPYLANFNVQWFRFELGNLNQMDFNEAEQEEFKLEDGDLLVCEGGEIGRCAVWRNELQPCFFQKALHRVRCNRKYILPDYLSWWFKYNCDHDGFSEIKGAKATIAHLPGIKLKHLNVAVPPLELQNQFASFVEQVANLKFVVQKSIDETQLLFDSLMQKYFS